MDDIQEMLIKLGRAGKVVTLHRKASRFVVGGREAVRLHDTLVCNEKSRPADSDIDCRKIQRVRYKGFVHCVSTPYRTIMVRRKGCPMWSGNSDQTTIARRYGNYVAEIAAYPGRETPTGAAAAELVALLHEADAPINVDAIGYGASAHERLADKPPGGYGLPARAINFAERSEFKDRSGRFKATNVRAEAFWRLREALDPEGGDDLALPPDPELLADLCAPTYRITPAGIRIEDKVEIKSRIGRSPDKGEGVILTMLPPPPKIEYRLYSLA